MTDQEKGTEPEAAKAEEESVETEAPALNRAERRALAKGKNPAQASLDGRGRYQAGGMPGAAGRPGTPLKNRLPRSGHKGS